MAAAAFRRGFRRRAVMMAALANRSVFIVKVVCQFIGVDLIDHGLENFTVRQLYRIVFIHQCLDGDGLRYILNIIGVRNGLAVFQGLGGLHLFLVPLHRIGSLRRWDHVAVHTGGGTLLTLSLKGRVAAGATLIRLLGFVTAYAALLGACPMHGLRQFYKTTFFGSIQGMAIDTGLQVGMVADPAGIIVGFMGLVIKGNKVHVDCRIYRLPIVFYRFDKYKIGLIGLQARNVG